MYHILEEGGVIEQSGYREQVYSSRQQGIQVFWSVAI